MDDDHRWSLLEDSRPQLIAAFADAGVTRIEYIAWFPEIARFAVWLCTATDRQRDDLAFPNPAERSGTKKRVTPQVELPAPISSTVRTVLRGCGFTETELSGLVVVAQSQETVDRDFEGSWFSAMR